MRCSSLNTRGFSRSLECACDLLLCACAHHPRTEIGGCTDHAELVKNLEGLLTVGTQRAIERSAQYGRLDRNSAGSIDGLPLPLNGVTSSVRPSLFVCEPVRCVCPAPAV